MAENRQTFQRAVNAALIGGVVNLLVAVLLLIMALWLASAVINTAAWYAFGGLGLWIILAVTYQQHKLERLESLEAEALAARAETDASIFQEADALSLSRRRLDRLYKWGLPIVSVLTGLYLIGIGFWHFTLYQPLMSAGGLSPDTLDVDPQLIELLGAKVLGAAELDNVGPGLVIGFLVGLFFVAFVIGRWVAGMAREGAWSMLRGGSAYLAGIALVTALLAIGHGLLFANYAWLLKYLAVGIPIFMMITGLEMLVNLVLNVYRPRKAGEMPRPAFDSRILSLLSTPGSIARALNESINYQFGFEITRSWFWQLAGRTMGWLVLLGVAVLFAVSSLVVVQPEQAVVVTRFGELRPGALGPGLHFKLPWPIEQVRYLDVERVHELRIGSAAELKADEPILWTNEHYQGEPVHLMVAIDDDRQAEGDQPEEGRNLSVALINAEVMIQYRISDPVAYVRQIADPAELLQAHAEAVLSRTLLRQDVDAWVGPNRRDVSQLLHDALTAYVDESKLGLDVLSVQVASLHPPQPVAEAFHQTLLAEQEREAMVEDARRDQIAQLAGAAGSVARAEAIIEQIDRRDAADDPEAEAALAAAIEQLLLEAGGEAAEALAAARAQRWQFENVKRGEVAIYQQQLAAAQAAPDYFRMRSYLIALTEGLEGTRKYLLLTDGEDRQIRLDLQPLDTGFGGLGTNN